MYTNLLMLCWADARKTIILKCSPISKHDVHFKFNCLSARFDTNSRSRVCYNGARYDRKKNVVGRTGVCLGLTARLRSCLSVRRLISTDWLVAIRNCTLIGPTRPWESVFSHVRHLVGAESAATWYLPIARDKELGCNGFSAYLIVCHNLTAIYRSMNNPFTYCNVFYWSLFTPICVWLFTT